MADVVAELGIIALFALLGGVLATRFRQPSVLGLLLAGALIGPNALRLVTHTDLIDALANIGAVLLLFTIGIEFSLSKLLKVGIRSLVIATFKLAFVFIATYEFALLIGMSLIEALIIGALLSITSTAIVAKVLADKGMKKRKETGVLIAVLIIEDVFAVFLLTFFSSLQKSQVAHGASDLLVPFITSLVVLAIVYVAAKGVLRRALAWILQYQAEETLVLTALALAVGLSYSAGWLGLAPSVGAFIAGSLAVTLPGGQAIERSIKPFSAVFSALFFVSIGMLITPASILPSLPLLFLFTFVSIGAKFFGTSLGSYLAGMHGRSAVFSGLAMLSTGEFSILLAQQARELVNFDVIGVTSIIVFTSTLATSILIGSDAKIYDAIERILPTGLKVRLLHAAQYFGAVGRNFEPGSPFFKATRNEVKSLLTNGAIIVFVLGATLLMVPTLQSMAMEAGGISIPATYLVFVLAIMMIIYPLAYALDSLKDIMDGLTDAFLRAKGRHDHLDMAVMRNVILFVGCILSTVYMPLILTTFRLEGLWRLSLLPLVLGVMLLWEIFKDIHEIFDLSTGKTHSGHLGELMEHAGLPLLRFERIRKMVRKKD